MKLLSYNITKISLGVIIPLMATSATFAQTVNTPDPANNTQSSEYDPFVGNTGGTNLNPTNLIHQYNLRRELSPEEFNTESQDSITQSAEEFRRQQQERYNNQPANQTSNNTPNQQP